MDWTPKIESTEIEGVFWVYPPSFDDHRGEIVGVFSEEGLTAAMREILPDWDAEFTKQNTSHSRQNVLRGIHVSPSRWKLAFCQSGMIYVIAADCRPGSPTFGKHIDRIITDDSAWQLRAHQLLIAPGIGLGHYVMSEEARFSYFWSGGYDGDSQDTIAWDDPTLNIKWPLLMAFDDELGMSKVVELILSERDRNGRRLDGCINHQSR